MSGIDIAIIINSYNRLSLLKECLGALSLWLPKSALKSRCVTVIYDAGSSDGSIQWLKTEAPGLELMLEVITAGPGDDTSFAAGLNAAVAYAEKKFPSLRYLLFYETDNQILESVPVFQALAHLEHMSRLAACGFTVRKHDGRPTGVGQPFPKLLNFFLGKKIVHYFQLEKIPYQWEKQMEDVPFSVIDVVHTSPLLVRIDAWKESGGLDAKTFPFSDCDVDWARRLHDLGWQMGAIHTHAVIHDNREVLSSWSRFRALQSHRGRLRYFFRHHPFTVYLVWPALLLLRHFLELMAVYFVIRDPVRRKRLSWQFLYLIRSCLRKYENTISTRAGKPGTVASLDKSTLPEPVLDSKEKEIFSSSPN